MTYAIILGVIVVLMVIIIWKTRQPQGNDEEFKDRLGEYNKSCRLVKLDYRDGKLSADEARAKLEEIGDRYTIPPYRRTKSLGALQVQKKD